MNDRFALLRSSQPPTTYAMSRAIYQLDQLQVKRLVQLDFPLRRGVMTARTEDLRLRLAMLELVNQWLLQQNM